MGEFATWIDLAKKEINEEYPELLSWLQNLPYDKQLYDILTREDDRVITIDTCTVLPRRVNILVIEDELLEE